MINGAHTIIYASDAEKTRAFFRDVLGFPCVDVGRGWLIFALPPGELAAHPTEGGDLSESIPPGHHQMFLTCADLDRTMKELKAKGAEFVRGISDEPWGRLTMLRVPGAGEIGLYQPKHERPPRA